MTPIEATAEAPEKSRIPRISVVIVSLNRADSLRASLGSLGTAHQVVVVDNGSTDGAARLDADFPEARFSKLPRNFGLTKALNIGIRAAEGEFILFLHDDTSISGDDVTKLADYLESHADAAAVCPLLNSPQTGPLPSPSAPVAVWQSADPSKPEITAECISNAAVMFRASFLRALRHIDERYGTFGSAIELSMQVRRAGKRLVILGDVRAHHEAAESPVKKGVLEGDRVAGMAAYLGKHHGFMAGLTYRVKAALTALFTLRFKSLMGAVSGGKIDGTA